MALNLHYNMTIVERLNPSSLKKVDFNADFS